MRTNLIKKEEKAGSPALEYNKLDMVIAFDTTGSMASYRDQVRKYVRDLIPKLLSQNPNLQIGIVVFGDYCDMISPSDFGSAYQVCDLTRDEDRLIEFVLGSKNNYGGDGDEFYELVINKITEETKWREDSTKAVLLIADSNPHPIGYSYRPFVVDNQIDWMEEARKAAAKGIKFDTATIGNNSWYKQLSKMTGGVHAPFSSNVSTTQYIEAAALARGGEATKELYYSRKSSFMDDREMSAVYAAYSKEVIS